MSNRALVFLILALLCLSPGFAIDLTITDSSIFSEVNGIRDITSLPFPRDTSVAPGASRASASYSFQNTSNRFQFSFTHQLDFIGDDIAIGTQGTIRFQLNEPAQYYFSGSNFWSGGSVEGGAGFVQLIRDPIEAGNIYAESDWIVAQNGFHAIQGIADGPSAILSGTNSGVLNPGAYAVHYAFQLADALSDHTNNSAMFGNFSFELIAQSAFQDRQAISEGIEFPLSETAGAKPWFRSFISHDGADSGQSGPISHNEKSSIKTSVPGPGVLSFWWKVSSARSDYLTILMDGTEIAHISGDVDWQQRFIQIPPNLHDIEWVYSKDHDNVAGLDAAWVDQVALRPTMDTGPTLNQTITIEGLNTSQIFGDPIAISATASSFLPITLTVLDGPAVFHGNVLVPLEPGTVTIRASQPGDSIFIPAVPVDRQVTFFAAVDPDLLAANTPELSVDVSDGGEHIVETLALEPDGKLIAGGSFDYAHGERRWNIARFNSDLTPDKTWHPKIEGGNVFTAAILGHYLFVGGNFTSVNQIPRAGLAKISLVDGSLDPDGNPAPNGLIWTMVAVENQLLVGGAFDRISGVPRNFMAKLNPTGSGSADSVWAPGPNGVVNAIALTGTNLFIAGSFDNIRGIQALSIAKIFLHGTGERDPFWNASINALGTRSLVATPTHLFAGGYYRSNATSTFGVAGFSADNGALALTAYPGRNAHKVAVHGNALYTGFWADGRLAPIVDRLSIPNFQVDSNWDPSILEDSGGGLATRVTDLLFRGADLYIAGDFSSFAGSPGSGVALLPTLEGAPGIKAISTTIDRMSGPGIVITPHPSDIPETTYFQITDLQNGNLFKADPLLPGVDIPLENGAFITRTEATNGLRFLPAPGFVGTATFKVLASKTPFLSGLGGAFGFGSIPVLADRIEQLISYALIPDTPFDVGSVSLNFVASSGLPLQFSITGPARIVGDNILRFQGVGEVMVIAQQFGNELYKPSARVGTIFNITKGRQSIAFEPLTDPHIATTVPLRATSSSGLPVSFSVVSGPATIANNAVTYTAAGEVTIRASQPGDTIHNPSPPVDQTVLVTGRPQTITFFSPQPIPFNSGSLPLARARSDHPIRTAHKPCRWPLLRAPRHRQFRPAREFRNPRWQRCHGHFQHTFYNRHRPAPDRRTPKREQQLLRSPGSVPGGRHYEGASGHINHASWQSSLRGWQHHIASHLLFRTAYCLSGACRTGNDFRYEFVLQQRRHRAIACGPGWQSLFPPGTGGFQFRNP